MPIFRRVSVFALLALGSVPALAATPIPPYVAQAVAATDRPAADVGRDGARHPAELVAFAGIKPGDSVADFMPGTGYFTRIFANVVGPKGHVFAIVPAEIAKRLPQQPAGMKALAAQPAFANVTPVVQPTSQAGTGETLDVAWTSDNYHDVYGFFGPAQAAAADASIFKALKPGGIFIVIDHVAPAGTSAASPKTLHRIDPATVKAQVEAAGFKLEAESDLLKNPADPHTKAVFDPSIRGKTDQFVFKFRKPAK